MPRRNRIARKDARRVLHSQMLRCNFGKDIAKIRGQRQVAAFVKLIISEPWPLAINLSTLHRSTQNEHGVGVAIVRPAIAVFARSASKLRHREYRDVGHLVAHILMERGERIAKIFQTIGELASHAAFSHVMIPAAHFREGDFQTPHWI